VPFDARRNGFALAEGAALVTLESADAATARGARIAGEVTGHAAAYDGPPSNGKKPGAAVARAIQLAVEDARLTLDDIDCLSASANGSIEGDRREAHGVASAFGERSRTLPVTAIKSMLGEGLGASGAWQVVAMLETLRHGVLPGIARLERIEPGLALDMAAPASRTLRPRHALITSISTEGNCCALVLSACESL
jgi:3-oxoacyl-[acyl-carrier-protein] synthase II